MSSGKIACLYTRIVCLNWLKKLGCAPYVQPTCLYLEIRGRTLTRVWTITYIIPGYGGSTEINSSVLYVANKACNNTTFGVQYCFRSNKLPTNLEFQCLVDDEINGNCVSINIWLQRYGNSYTKLNSIV